MINLTDNRKEIENQLTYNLGIDALKTGGYLSTTLDGFYKATDSVIKSIETEIDDLFVDTANINKLEIYGVNQGMPRIKSKDINFYSSHKDLKLIVELYKPTKDLQLQLFKKGDITVSDIYELTFYTNVNYNSNIADTYITCNLKVMEGYSYNTVFLYTGTFIYVPVPNNLKNTIKSLKFEVLEDKLFSKEVESENSYRMRLSAALKAKNLSNETYIDAALKSIPKLYRYYIDKNSYPTKVYLLTLDMYNNDYISYNNHVYPHARYKLAASKGYNDNFELLAAVPVDFSLNIDTENGEYFSDNIIDDLISYLLDNHKLGQGYIISKETLQTFLDLKNINTNINIQISLHFNGVKILNKTPDYLVLKSEQFPRLVSISINEGL